VVTRTRPHRTGRTACTTRTTGTACSRTRRSFPKTGTGRPI